jgi:hypothetical protein
MITVGALTIPFHLFEFEDRDQQLFHVGFGAWEEGLNHQTAANLREDYSARIAAAFAGTRGLGQCVLEIAIWGAPDSKSAEAKLTGEIQQIIHQ